MGKHLPLPEVHPRNRCSPRAAGSSALGRTPAWQSDSVGQAGCRAAIALAQPWAGRGGPSSREGVLRECRCQRCAEAVDPGGDGSTQSVIYDGGLGPHRRSTAAGCRPDRGHLILATVRRSVLGGPSAIWPRTRRFRLWADSTAPSGVPLRGLQPNQSRSTPAGDSERSMRFLVNRMSDWRPCHERKRLGKFDHEVSLNYLAAVVIQVHSSNTATLLRWQYFVRDPPSNGGVSIG
jgi:hypothetical protein